MYPSLHKPYKGLYQFRLGTTSFIYPDNYISNVKMLGPYLNEIELLLFESAYDSLPSKQEIKELSMLAKEFDITYDIHLPLDIYLGDKNPAIRRRAIDTIKQIVDLTLPLAPSIFTLHFSYDEAYDEDSSDKDIVKKWQERIYESMDRLLSTGIKSRSIAIENLMYPFEWAEKVISSLNLSVCIDTGHLILMNTDIIETFNKYHDRTSIIHIHGVEDSLDHLSLDKLADTETSDIMKILKTFAGIVIIEVFSYDNLQASLKYLEKSWK
ncbi:MAG: cobamide remodeling phosphodiesterase CbiR [Thermodesulfobacteriota bacterium]|nr:cobamide remodeling phosphodiesterase CbiR [Thermodesulfobacteriota bacterium]